MTGRLAAQLGHLFSIEAERTCHEHEWPPVRPTEEEIEEAARLDAIARAHYRVARRRGFKGDAFAEVSR